VLEAEGYRSALQRIAEPVPEREFAGIRVLLAEDNEANRFVAQELLTVLGIELETAVNGREAVDRVRAKRYAAVLMDMQMPEVDGLEATRLIRQDKANAALPIIAMTANAMKADVEACLEAGMNDFVSKPIDRVELLRTLRRWLPRDGGPASLAPEPDILPQIAVDEVVAHPAAIDVEDVVRRLGLPFEQLRPLYLRLDAGLRQTLEDLHRAVTAEDARGSCEHAHALAGAAGNFGAARLFQSAKELEAAARAGRTDLSSLFTAVEQAATSVFAAIDNMRQSLPRNSTTDSRVAPLDRANLQRALERLQNALANLDLSGSSVGLDEIDHMELPAALRTATTRIRGLVEGYEYDEAAAAVTRLLADLAAGGQS
jgi:CheY-like chemotaxis protein